ncbi:hypothetical protein [Burkholderia gladioli]|uniref:hypothetical protein n=1 Tax=Burkholderia gladioli TaxID=28095 RepID=UPI001FC7F0C6|nr:hypothetical protein [Burkholderia gladioli]
MLKRPSVARARDAQVEPLGEQLAVRQARGVVVVGGVPELAAGRRIAVRAAHEHHPGVAGRLAPIGGGNGGRHGGGSSRRGHARRRSRARGTGNIGARVIALRGLALGAARGLERRRGGTAAPFAGQQRREHDAYRHAVAGGPLQQPDRAAAQQRVDTGRRPVVAGRGQHRLQAQHGAGHAGTASRQALESGIGPGQRTVGRAQADRLRGLRNRTLDARGIGATRHRIGGFVGRRERFGQARLRSLHGERSVEKTATENSVAANIR